MNTNKDNRGATMMKSSIFKMTVFTLFFSAGVLFFSPLSAMACGYGNSGGTDYVPQRQGGFAANPAPAAPSIGSEQAKNIVGAHVTRLNPDLGVGSVTDSGGFFEVEVLDKNNEVVQLLGVDKYSGRLMLIN